jgi:hypothetical protein
MEVYKETGVPDEHCLHSAVHDYILNGTLLKMISVLSHVVTGTLHENSDSLNNGNESLLLCIIQ